MALPMANISIVVDGKRMGATTDNMLELDRYARERIFNLGYYTWVEQQGVSLADFEARRAQQTENRSLNELS